MLFLNYNSSHNLIKMCCNIRNMSVSNTHDVSEFHGTTFTTDALTDWSGLTVLFWTRRKRLQLQRRLENSSIIKIGAQSPLADGSLTRQKPEWKQECVSLVLPAACVAQDCQGVREAVQVVVSQVQCQGLAGFSRDKAPTSMSALEVQENWDPLQ